MSRETCIENIKGVAPLELYEKLLEFGNKNLGHIWTFTPDEVMKVMTCLVNYCVNSGEEPNNQEAKDMMVKTLEWSEGNCGVRLTTWAS